MQLPVLVTRHSHSLFVNVLVCIELSLDSIGSSGYKEISFIKIDQGGPEIGQPQNSSELIPDESPFSALNTKNSLLLPGLLVRAEHDS